VSKAPPKLAHLSPEQRDLLLRRVREQRAAEPARAGIERRPDLAAPVPLSFAQQRLWFLDQLQPGGTGYNIPVAVQITGGIRIGLLRATVRQLIRRHESLRTTFHVLDGKAVQIVSPPSGTPEAALPVIDLTGLAPDTRERLASELCQSEASRLFDLGRGPLLRPLLLRLAEDRHVLSLVFHHIISDLWSLGVFIREMTVVYASLETGGPALPELPVQYPDYAAWQREQLRGESLDREIAHWKRELEGAPASLDLPTDHPRPPVLGDRGAWLPWRLPVSPADRLRALGQARGATLFMTMLAAYSVLLARFSGQDDLVIGSPVANRPRVELEGLIGFFINLLVLRVDLRGNPTFPELLGRVKEKSVQALHHQELPFEQLVGELRLERDLSRQPLIQAVLALQNISLPRVERPDLRFDPVHVELDTVKFDLSLELQETGGELWGNLGYSTELFERSTAERIGRCFGVLLESLGDSPELPVWEVPLLAESERQQVLREGRPGLPRRSPESLPARVAAMARRSPEAPAFAGAGGMVLSYGELVARAGRVATGLRELGVGPEIRVGVLLERSPELLVALLGTLAAGGTCLLLNPGRDRSWLERMLERSGCAVLLTRGDLLRRLPEHGAAEVLLERLEQREQEMVDWEGIDPESLAFVVQTAGPHRQARLVGLPHRGVAAWVEAWRERLEPEDLRAMASDGAPETVDGVFDLLVPLCLGGCLAAGEAGVDPSLRSATPSRLAEDLRQGTAGSARAVRSFGEILGGSLRARLHAAGVEKVFDSFSSALGGVGPVEGLEACVLGRSGEPVPLGVVGELWLGGEGLARGFDEDAARTAGRFVPDPFGDRPGGRLVRTGDRARWRADGRLEILGGVERFVQVRGLRLDLGSFEEILGEHPKVLRAVAVLQDDGGGPRLVAHALSTGPDEPTPEELRAFLRSRLPEPLVPWGIAVVSELPRTPAGRVDVQALPRIEPEATRGDVSPRNEAEKVLAEIWRELLRVDEVGVQDNFFQLGGDSILALQVAARARQAGWAVMPRQLFSHQTIAELAEVAEPLRAQADEEDVSVPGPIPLTSIQSWFFEQDLIRPEHWNQSVLLAARRPLGRRALERAFGAVAACHGALRLRLRREETGWTQWIDPPGPPSLTWVDLSALPAGRRAPALEEGAARLQASLDLGGPLMRAAVFRLGAGEGDRLLWIVHHLAVDAVSWRILLEDLESAYRQAEEGREPRLAPETTSFPSWARRLAGHRRDPRLERAREVWSALAGRIPPGPSLAAGGREGEAERVVVSLEEAETRSLLRRAQGSEGIRIDDLLLTALLAAWREWTGSHALHLHLEGHGRDDPFGDTDLSRTVGWLTALTPVLLEAGEGADAEAMLATVRERLRSLPNGIEFGLLRESLPQLPKPPVLFNNLGQLDLVLGPDALWAPAAESTGPSRDPGERRVYPLELNAGILQGRFHLELRSGPGERAQGLADAFAGALRGLIERDRSAAVVYPTTPLQKGFLFHTLLAPDSGIYVTQLSCLLRGDLDVAAFGTAWRRLIERHSALRTRFAWEGLAEPVQIEEAEVGLPLTLEDWSSLSASEQEERFQELQREDRRRGFVLSKAPLLRLWLLRLGPGTHRFLCSLHHLLSDGWSLAILIREGFAYYEAAARGRDLHLPEPRPYRDYVRWLEEHPPERSRDFWRRRLAGFTEPTPIRLGPEPATVADRPDHAEEALLLPDGLSSALRDLARRSRVTLYTVFAGAFSLLLRRLSGRDDVVFGTVVSGRPSTVEGMERRVGCFINTLPARVSTSADLPLASWLRTLHAGWAETEEHQQTPLLDITAWSEVGPGKPLFSTLLVFENYPVQRSMEEWRGDLAIEDLHVIEQTNYPLNLMVVPGDRILLSALFDRQTVHPAAVRGALLYLETVLRAMAEEPETRLPGLPLLTPPERHQLLFEWSGAAPLLDPELAGPAAFWAGRLRALGVGPRAPVCILLEQGPLLDTALLAAGKAGGVSLLLCPSNRLERLLSLLHDSGAQVLLTDRVTASRLRDEVGDIAILEIGGREAAEEGESVAAEPGSAVFLLDAVSPPGRATRLHLLDPGLLPVPVWAVGERCLGGEELAQGFWRRPDLTAERFLPDPFGEEPGARLFRTGELARRLPDGAVVPLILEAPAEPVVQAEPVPPRDEVERKLAAIWEDLLGIAGAGVRDNFFVLGGHSLLAVRVMSRIEQDLGAELPLNALFQAPTIEGLAARIAAQSKAADTELLVPLQPQGQNPPLFFVHPVGGSVFCYQPLAGRLGPDQPFWGLQAAEGGGDTTIEEMAARYLEALRGVQPAGPYHLGGWSMGGVIAFEMARQLWATGETVALLALVDAPPAEPGERLPDLPDDDSWFLRFAADLVGLRGFGSPTLGSEILELDPDSRLRWLHERAREREAILADVSLARFRNRFELFQRNARALAGYVPRPLPGGLLFLRCEENPSATAGEPTRGWGRLAAAGASAHTLRTDHYSVLREPHAAVVARLLREAMESAVCSTVEDGAVSPAV
jgi:non-ribosomal peptide synthase protein (TIGR01720 family)